MEKDEICECVQRPCGVLLVLHILLLQLPLLLLVPHGLRNQVPQGGHRLGILNEEVLGRETERKRWRGGR